MDKVTKYINDVRNNKIVVGRLVRLAVDRHVSDMARAGDDDFPYYFDEGKANLAIEFIEGCCKHSTGEWAGQDFKLEPWQAFIVASLFGWRRSDGTRRFRKALISVARKNGKTALAATIALLVMVCDTPPEPRAEIWCAATKEDQAALLFNEAKRMVGASPELSAVIERHKKAMTVYADESTFKPIGSDSDKTDGLNPHAVFKDELHAWHERHRGLHEKLSTGGGARRQPIEIIITTAGDDKSQLWIEEDDFAAKTLEASADGESFADTYFAFVARIDDKDDPLDETNWIKGNPNLGVSVKLDYLRDQADLAANDPTKLNQFVRYHGNRKVASVEKLISRELWMAGKSAPNINGGDTICVGMDIGRSDDWAAIAGIKTIEIPYADEKEYDIMAKCFSCEDGGIDWTMQPFMEWRESGLVHVSPGDQIDITAIKSEIIEWHDEYNIASLGFDPTFAWQLSQELINDFGINAIKLSQTHATYNEPIRLLLRALGNGQVRHGGDPVLAWQADNVKVKTNGRGEWMPDKLLSRKHKIDAIVAVLMGLREAMFVDSGGSFGVGDEVFI